MVAVEQRHETRLRPRRAFDAAGLQLFQAVFRLVQVERQVVGPQAGAFAHGGGLSGLQVREAQARQVAVFDGKVRQRADHARQPAADQLQRLAEQHQIRIVRHVTAGGAQVDDRSGQRANVAIRVHVRHHVVADLPLVPVGGVVVDVVHMGPQLGDLLVADRQAQFLFRLGQRHPQPPPSAELLVVTPQPAHFLGSVADNQRVLVLVVGHGAPVQLAWSEELSLFSAGKQEVTSCFAGHAAGRSQGASTSVARLFRALECAAFETALLLVFPPFD